MSWSSSETEVHAPAKWRGRFIGTRFRLGYIAWQYGPTHTQIERWVYTFRCRGRNALIERLYMGPFWRLTKKALSDTASRKQTKVFRARTTDQVGIFTLFNELHDNDDPRNQRASDRNAVDP